MSNMHDINEPGSTTAEKRLWLSLASTLVVFTFYVIRALQLGDAPPAQLAGLFVVVVGAQIAIEIVGNVAIAVRNRQPEPRDERDHRIAVRAARNSYYVLVVGVWCALTTAVVATGARWPAHVLLVCFVIAELARFGSQLVYYRRGV